MMKTFRGFEPVMVEIAKGVERLYKQADASRNRNRASPVRTWMLIAFALSVILVCGLSLLIGRSISKALASMVSAMTRLAGGEFKIAIPGLGRKDEIGEMARRGRGIQEQHDRSGAAARRTARGRSSGRREQRKADMRELANAFEGAVGEIVETVSSAATELEASANTLTQAADAIAEPRDHGCGALPRKPPPMCSRCPRPAKN